MKYFILIFVFGFASCSKEVYTVKKAKKNIAKTELIAKKLFNQFSQETFLKPSELSGKLNESEIEFLTRKLKCPYVHVTYGENNPAFFKADSVVMFTRTGMPVFGKQHNIIFDMRKNIRDSIVVDRNYLKYYKVVSGVFYVQDLMPGF
jgi:hypothetical protein